MFLFFLPADSDLIETFPKGVLKGGSFLCVSQWRMKLNMHVIFFFFFFLSLASTNVGGEREKKKSSMVIDDNTKQKVRCLRSSVTLLFRHFYYDDNEGSGNTWIY